MRLALCVLLAYCFPRTTVILLVAVALVLFALRRYAIAAGWHDEDEEAGELGRWPAPRHRRGEH